MDGVKEPKNDSFIPMAPAEVRAPQMMSKTYPTSKPPLPSPKEPSRRSPTLSRLTNPSITPARAAAPTSVLPSPVQDSLMTVAPRQTPVMENSLRDGGTAVMAQDIEKQRPSPELHGPDQRLLISHNLPKVPAEAIDGETDWDALVASFGCAATCGTSTGQPQSFY